MLEVEPIKLVSNGASSEVFARRLHHRYATAELPSAAVISFSRVIRSYEEKLDDAFSI